MRIREAQGTDVPEQRELPTATGVHLPEAEPDAQAVPDRAEAIIQGAAPLADGAARETVGGAAARILIL